MKELQNKLLTPNKEKNEKEILGDLESFNRYKGANELSKKIKDELGFLIENISQINAGANNGVFVLQNGGGQKLIAKIYQKDERKRLDREYRACDFLRQHGFSVPEALIRVDKHEMAVYSFEDGERKDSEELSEQDLRLLVDFIVALQEFTPNTVDTTFESGIHAQASFDDVLRINSFRIKKIKEALLRGQLHPDLESFLESTGIVDKISRLGQARMKKWSKPPWNLDKNEQRLSPIDFGAHNALFREKKPPCIVDLEYFGWDDPLKIVADFIAHDKSLGLSDKLKQRVVKYYQGQVNLSKEEGDRLNLLIDMANIEWMAIHLQSLTPRYVKARKFSSADKFNYDEYVERQIKKVKLRYEKII